jgi:hypothetical protein
MAKWQTPMMQSEMGNRMAAGVPALLATYFAKLPANVHFVNVGARVEGMHQALRGNISYIPQCSPDRFDVLLGSADLLLGLNVGATTVARAMFAGTPTLVLSNRYRIASAEDRTLDAFAADTKSWVLKHLPLYPMRMMPLGFYAFFGPIVEDNSYFNTFEHAELLHEPDVIHKMHELLFNPIARAAMAARRETYLAELDLLSDPTDSIVALSGVTSAV